MLAKKHRLTEKSDFQNVQKTGRTFQFSSFGIAVLDRKDTNPSRFAFIISTKVAKDAVDRNTIRRHMSETIRLQTNYIKDGLDVVFLAKTNITRTPADMLIKEVRASLSGAGLTK